jgi:hypothetical protein
MTDKASIETLNLLHGIVAKKLLEKIRSGKATAADLNVARAFLKDNNIEQAHVPGTPMADLARDLPFAGADTYQ